MFNEEVGIVNILIELDFFLGRGLHQMSIRFRWDRSNEFNKLCTHFCDPKTCQLRHHDLRLVNGNGRHLAHPVGIAGSRTLDLRFDYCPYQR